MPAKPSVLIRVLLGQSQIENAHGAGAHLMVSIAGPKVNPGVVRPPLRLVIALDISSSMNEPAGEGDATTKLALAKRVIHRLLPFLRDEDMIGLLAFSNHATLLLQPTAMTKAGKKQLDDVAEALKIAMSTNVGAAIELGCETAQALCGSGAPAHVLFLTDGQPTVGIQDTRNLLALLGNNYARGVRLLCAGVGRDYNPRLLEALARTSNGLFVHIEGEAQFAQAMGDLLGAAASVQHANLRVQITPTQGVRIAQVFTLHQTVMVGEACHVHLGDVFAEAIRAVGFELRIDSRNPRPTQPVTVCTVEVRGTDVASGKSWQAERTVEAQLVEPGRATAPHEGEVYRVLTGLVAQSAAHQAMEAAEQGRLDLAMTLIEGAIRFVEHSVELCRVNATEALQHLHSILEIFRNPEEFERGRHRGTSTTCWVGGRGSQAPGGQTRAQARVTELLAALARGRDTGSGGSGDAN